MCVPICNEVCVYGWGRKCAEVWKILIVWALVMEMTISLRVENVAIR